MPTVRASLDEDVHSWVVDAAAAQDTTHDRVIEQLIRWAAGDGDRPAFVDESVGASTADTPADTAAATPGEYAPADRVDDLEAELSALADRVDRLEQTQRGPASAFPGSLIDRIEGLIAGTSSDRSRHRPERIALFCAAYCLLADRGCVEMSEWHRALYDDYRAGMKASTWQKELRHITALPEVDGPQQGASLYEFDPAAVPAEVADALGDDPAGCLTPDAGEVS
jgi:hypothetical protein